MQSNNQQLHEKASTYLDIQITSLLAINLLILQNLFSSETISPTIIYITLPSAFAIPFLTGCFFEKFVNGHKTKLFKFLQVNGVVSTLLGIILVFWHISFLTGIAFLLASIITVFAFCITLWPQLERHMKNQKNQKNYHAKQKPNKNKAPLT